MTERNVPAARVLELAEELERYAAGLTEDLNSFEWAKDQARAGCLGGGSSMLNEAARRLRALVERSGEPNCIATGRQCLVEPNGRCVDCGRKKASEPPGSPAATDRLIDALRALATAHGYELVDYAVRVSAAENPAALCPYCSADTGDGSVCARCHPGG